LTKHGIHCTYVRAVYMTGSTKIETSVDKRRYGPHKKLLDPEGNPVLREDHNYITIRGYYNGPDEWVAEQKGPLYEPVDLGKAVGTGIIDESECSVILKKMKTDLNNVHYNGSLLKPDDILLSQDSNGNIVKDDTGSLLAVICNFRYIYRNK